MKKTLLEKMQARDDIPKSWLAEVRRLVRRADDAEGKAEEYGLLIDTLALENEALLNG